MKGEMMIALAAVALRETPNPKRVARYVRMLRKGSVRPPPIYVVRRHTDAGWRWLVLDGHHRVAAARAVGLSHIRATRW
jgi:hypothetical protein